MNQVLNIPKNPIKFGYPHFLILLCILLDPSFNMLGLIDYTNISILGLFKSWDVPIILLTIHFFYSRDKTYKEKYIIKNVVIMIILFVIFYIVYTVAIIETSTIMEAIKSSRSVLYIYLYFIFGRYLDIDMIYFFWRFYRFLLVFGFILLITAYLGFNFVYVAYDYNIGAMRGIIYDSTTNMFLFIFSLFQIILNYKGKFKLTKFEIFIVTVNIFVSYNRNHWLAAIAAIIIIYFLTSLHVSKKLDITKNFKYVLTILLFASLAVGIMTYTQSSEKYLDRLIAGKEDIQYGLKSGSFTNRLDNLNTSMSYLEYYGLQYTGVGYAHPYYSTFIAQIVINIGFWGTEMEIGMNLLTYGYIGVALFYLLRLLMVKNIFLVSIKEENNFSFIFGVALAINIFVLSYVSAWAGGPFGQIISFTFILSMLNKIINEPEALNEFELKGTETRLSKMLNIK